MSGYSWRIFRRSSLAQTMKAFMGLLTWVDLSGRAVVDLVRAEGLVADGPAWGRRDVDVL